MKYRVIARKSDDYPFQIQRKDETSIFFWWRNIEKCSSHHEAFRYVRDATERHSKYKSGSVVLEYDESDLVLEKLKNRAEHDSGVNTQSAQTMNATPKHMKIK